MSADVIQTLERWWANPLTGKLVFLGIGLVVILALTRLLRTRSASRPPRSTSINWRRST